MNFNRESQKLYNKKNTLYLDNKVDVLGQEDSRNKQDSIKRK